MPSNCKDARFQRAGVEGDPVVEDHRECVREAYESEEYENIEKWLIGDLKAVRWLELSGVIPRLIELSRMRHDSRLGRGIHDTSCCYFEVVCNGYCI